MPTYDYKCDNCNNIFEFFQSMKDDPMTLCPECGHEELKKQVSLPAGLIFKGTGFYLTDYAKNKTSPSTNSGNTSTESNTAKSDSKPSNDKPEKKESKSKENK